VVSDALNRLNALEEIGLKRDFTEAELTEIDSVMTVLSEVPPTYDEGHDQQINHVIIAFWQHIAMGHPTTNQNIKAMHKHVARHILSLFSKVKR